MRRLALAFLVGTGIGLGCARQSAPPPAPAPAPALVFASFVIHNRMPVSLDVYMVRAGWADIPLRQRIRPRTIDTIDVNVPKNSAFRLMAVSRDDPRFWSETEVIFAISAFRFEWKVLSPLYLRDQRRRADNGR
jgi:hypothetical protein